MADFATETFSALTNWTQIGPGDVFTLSSNQLLATADADGTYGGLVYNTQTASLKQHAKLQLVAVSGAGYAGFIFRRTGVADENFYKVVAGIGDAGIYWETHQDNAVLSFVASIDAQSIGDNFAAGDWFGVEIDGTGDNTVVKAWRWTSDPGAYDAGYTNWGAPGLTMLTNPGANACDTGLYLGIFAFLPSTGNTCTSDNWTGGEAGGPSAKPQWYYDLLRRH